MQQWEYTIEWGAPEMSDLEFLNFMGKSGWQLCAVYERRSYYFKRPIPQPSTAEKIFNEVKNEVEGE